MLRDLLTTTDIARISSRAAYEKGSDYQLGNHVSQLTVDDDFTRITSLVNSAGVNRYAVRIVLTLREGKVESIDGRCTCPMSLNCKHVVATLLQALALERSERGREIRAGWTREEDAEFERFPVPILRPREPIAPPEPSGLPPGVAAWLEQIGQAVRGDDYPPDVTHRLLYVLAAHDVRQPQVQLAVQMFSVRALKDGRYSDKYSVVKPSDFDGERAPKFYRDVDLGIMSRLQRERGGQSHDGKRPLQSIGLVQQMVATGRAFWRDYRGAPLRWGEARSGRIDWRLVSEAGVSPVLVVDQSLAINAEPPLYLDEAGGLLGPVEVSLPPRLAFRLLAAPAIPPGRVAEVARQLGLKLPGLRADLLPTPPEPALAIDEKPVPVLRLGVTIAPYGYPVDRIPMAVARLGFRYGTVELPLVREALPVDAVRDGRLYRVRRDPGAERAALGRLRGFGFADARRSLPSINPEDSLALALEGREAWLEFLFSGVDTLKAQGFEILADADFPFRMAKPSGEVDAEIESSGLDWFELKLGVAIDGRRHDLARVLAALVGDPSFDPKRIEHLAETDHPLYLPMADGRLLALAARRFLPLIMALHGVSLGGLVVDDSGGIRLSRAGMVPLLAMETAGVAFRGADNLRRLAGFVQSRGLPPPALPASFQADLRPYQAEGVAWLDLLRESGLGGVLADDMGLGKTVQLLALLALEKARGGQSNPVLVVAPTSLVGNWVNEARKFAPDLKVLVLHGVARKSFFAAIGDHDIVLTTYPLIARDHAVLLAREWHMAILDEAQVIKNPNAATTRWLSGIKAHHRFCLTGTPMENHLGELWSLMNFANPGFLGDKTGFSRNWRTPIERHGDGTRAKALARRVKPFLLRRTKAEVATELPPKTEIVERITLEGSQRDLYDSIRIAMSAEVRQAIQERGLAKSHIIVLQALLKLRQACCDPTLLKLGVGIAHPSAKLDRLIEMVTELLSEGRKIIIFSQFTSMLALIQSRLDESLTRYSLLTGSTRDRLAEIDAFQNGDRPVFLVSLKAGGVGLNLTAADTVIVYDPWWNPAVEEQAIDRAYRIGQDKAVFVYRLVATATIEEKMDELKARKRALADGLFDPEGRLGAALTEDDVAALFED